MVGVSPPTLVSGRADQRVGLRPRNTKVGEGTHHMTGYRPLNKHTRCIA